MKAFSKTVKGLKGKWIVTINDTPDNRSLIEGCPIQSLSTAGGCSNSRTDGPTRNRFHEIIIKSWLKP